MTYKASAESAARLAARGIETVRVFDGPKGYCLIAKDRYDERGVPLRITTQGAAGKLGRRGKA